MRAHHGCVLPSPLQLHMLIWCLAAFFGTVLADATERHLQEGEAGEAATKEEGLPTGISVTGFTRRMDILVIPSWDLFLGFSDRRKIIDGRFTVISVYEELAQWFVGDPHTVIDVENFGDGTKREMGTLAIHNPILGNGQSSTTVYIGEFSQASSPNFDMLCFPFDKKETVFRIALQRPTEMVFRLELHCEGIQTNRTLNGKDIEVCTSKEEKGSYVGFDWGKFVCQQDADDLITCSMSGTRQTDAIFNSYMWPSLIFTLMGFLSFALDVKMAMPRVGTTMLALVSLTNLRNSVVSTLPTSGSISWLEEYFLVSKTFMFLNLAGHAVSFYLDSIGKKDLQRLANRCNLWGMLMLMWLIVLSRLLVRQCELVDNTMLTVLLVLLILALLGFIGSVVWLYRAALQLLPTSVVPMRIQPPQLFVGKGVEEKSLEET